MSKAQSRSRPRRLRRWVLFLFFAPLVILILGNLIGATSLGTDFVRKRIEKRLGLDCEISRLSWTPWGGGVLRGLKLRSAESSESFAEVGKVTLDPSWKSMLQRKNRFDSLTIEDLTLDLSLEEFREILAARKARPAQTPSRVDQPKPIPEEKKEEGENPETKEPKIIQKKNPEATEVDAPALAVRPEDHFEGTIILKNVDFKLSSISRPELAIQLNDIEAEIPLWGKARSGEIVFSKIQIGNDGNIEKLELPIQWKNQLLEIDESQIHLLGVRLALSVSVRLTQGLPYGISLNFPSQRINFTSMRKNAPPLDIHDFRSQNTLQGYLLHPSLLYGVSQSDVGVTELIDPKDGSLLRFERGRAEVSLNSSGLFSRDFHLIGDQEAVLANGYLSSGGEGSATVRVVAAPERAREYEKRIRAVSRDWTLAFQPLVTPDRLYRDLRFDLSNGALLFDIGKDGKAVSFRQAFDKIQRGYQPAIVPEIP